MKTQESFELYQNNPNNYISFLNGLSLIKQQICVFFYTSDVNFMLMLKWVFYSSNVLCYELYLSFEARRQPWPRPKRHPRAVIPNASRTRSALIGWETRILLDWQNPVAWRYRLDHTLNTNVLYKCNMCSSVNMSLRHNSAKRKVLFKMHFERKVAWESEVAS